MQNPFEFAYLEKIFEKRDDSMIFKDYDEYFWIAVFSNAILLAAMTLIHVRSFTSKAYFALFILLYIPCEFGSLYLLLKKMKEMKIRKNKEAYLKSLSSSYQKDIQKEISKERKLLSAAHTKLIEDLKEFDIERDISYQGPANSAYCENMLVNALITHKMRYAKKHHIRFSCDIALSDMPEETEQRTITLLANLLDNAFKAALKSKNPYVKLTIIERFKIVQLTLVNSIEPGIIVDLSQTTKSNKYKHGYGMKIIEGFIKDYNGKLIFTQKDNLFEQQITFSLNKSVTFTNRFSKRSVSRKNNYE